MATFSVILAIMAVLVALGMIESHKEKRIVPSRHEWLKVIKKEWKNEIDIIEDYLRLKGLLGIIPPRKLLPRFRLDTQDLRMEGVIERRKGFITLCEYDLPMFQYKTTEEMPQKGLRAPALAYS